jgi:hypothetical protein
METECWRTDANAKVTGKAKFTDDLRQSAARVSRAGQEQQRYSSESPAVEEWGRFRLARPLAPPRFSAVFGAL